MVLCAVPEDGVFNFEEGYICPGVKMETYHRPLLWEQVFVTKLTDFGTKINSPAAKLCKNVKLIVIPEIQSAGHGDSQAARRAGAAAAALDPAETLLGKRPRKTRLFMI